MKILCNKLNTSNKRKKASSITKKKPNIQNMGSVSYFLKDSISLNAQNYRSMQNEKKNYNPNEKKRKQKKIM